YLDRLMLKNGEEILFLKTAEIDWIEAAGNYVNLHLGKKAYLYRETMNNLEQQLDPRKFVR
ncbi:MAG: LytTR family transcriptional regulator, partial [Calditrichaeota bacterium]|nr:LytTR family transcriptional regulator [Calditrichota bacterium]